MSATPADPRSRQRLVRDSLIVGVATGAYGVSFGAVATTSGLNVAQACALSLLMFTGASQFAYAGVISGGGNAFAGAATAMLIGARNGLYGLRLSSILGVRGPKRLAAAHILLDESSAMAVVRDRPEAARLAYWLTGLSLFVCWNLFTLLGAVGADALSEPRDLGLDVAAPAAFVALLAPRMRSRDTWLVAVAAATTALAVTPFVQSGIPVLCAAAVTSLLALVARGGPSDATIRMEPTP